MRYEVHIHGGPLASELPMYCAGTGIMAYKNMVLASGFENVRISMSAAGSNIWEEMPPAAVQALFAGESV